MNSCRIWAFAIATLIVPGILWAQPPTTALVPTTADSVRALLTQGEYVKAITEADRILRAESNRLSDAQVYDLEMLKAEALLQGKHIPQAIGSYMAAIPVAPDLRSLGAARAGMTMLGRIQGTNYIPKTGPNRQPIDVLDDASRKRAMAALAADVGPQSLRAAQNALAGTTLPPAEDAFVPLLDLYALQVESGTPAETTLKTLKDLADHVHRLLTAELQQVARRVHDADRASGMFDAFSVSGRRGLNSNERDELTGLVTYIDQIENRLLIYRQAAQRLAGKTDRWDALLAQYSSLRGDLQGVLRYAS